MIIRFTDAEKQLLERMGYYRKLQTDDGSMRDDRISTMRDEVAAMLGYAGELAAAKAFRMHWEPGSRGHADLTRGPITVAVKTRRGTQSPSHYLLPPYKTWDDRNLRDFGADYGVVCRFIEFQGDYYILIEDCFSWIDWHAHAERRTGFVHKSNNPNDDLIRIGLDSAYMRSSEWLDYELERIPDDKADSLHADTAAWEKRIHTLWAKHERRYPLTTGQGVPTATAT